MIGAVLLIGVFLTGIVLGAWLTGRGQSPPDDEIIEEMIRRLREAGTIFPEDLERIQL